MAGTIGVNMSDELMEEFESYCDQYSFSYKEGLAQVIEFTIIEQYDNFVETALRADKEGNFMKGIAASSETIDLLDKIEILPQGQLCNLSLRYALRNNRDEFDEYLSSKLSEELE